MLSLAVLVRLFFIIEVVNGSSMLPQAVLKKLKEFQLFKLHTESPVFKIDNSKENK